MRQNPWPGRDLRIDSCKTKRAWLCRRNPGFVLVLGTLTRGRYARSTNPRFTGNAQNENDDKFDLYVGALQDILLDEEFEKMTKTFTNKYCMEFEATEENKLSYTSIFKEYQ